MYKVDKNILKKDGILILGTPMIGTLLSNYLEKITDPIIPHIQYYLILKV